jgi:hypothetical protein
LVEKAKTLHKELLSRNKKKTVCWFNILLLLRANYSHGYNWWSNYLCITVTNTRHVPVQYVCRHTVLSSAW